MAIHNKEATLVSFFDTDKIKAVCSRYKMQFQRRLTVTAHGTVQLLGEKLPSVQMAESKYECRKRTKRKYDAIIEQNARIEAEKKMDELSSTIKALESEVRKEQKCFRTSRQEVNRLKKNKTKYEGKEQERREDLKVEQEKRGRHRRRLDTVNSRLRNCRSQRYRLEKSLEAEPVTEKAIRTLAFRTKLDQHTRGVLVRMQLTKSTLSL